MGFGAALRGPLFATAVVMRLVFADILGASPLACATDGSLGYLFDAIEVSVLHASKAHGILRAEVTLRPSTTSFDVTAGRERASAYSRFLAHSCVLASGLILIGCSAMPCGGFKPASIIMGEQWMFSVVAWITVDP